MLSLAENKYVLIGAAVAALALFVYVKKNGGVAGAAAAAGETAGEAAVGAAGGLATGVIDGISTAVGMPTISETIKDGAACKKYIAANGYWSGVTACSAPALYEATSFNPLNWF